MSDLRPAQKFRGFATPRQPGEVARLRVVQGPDQGNVFIILSNLTRVGRGEENQVILNDLKASRTHGELQFTTQGWMFVDPTSSNGFLHNREPSRRAKLGSGDLISIGETTLEFLTVDQGTRILTSTPKSPSELKAEELAFEQQRARVRGLAQQSGTHSSPSKARVWALLGVAAVALYFWLEQEKHAPPTSAVKNPAQASGAPSVARDLSSYVPGGAIGGDAASQRTIEMFFREGMREFRERNYLRARSQFESILQIRPDHELAKRYLANSNSAIQDEIKMQLQRGRRNFESGKLRSARGNFEAVLRLLARDQQNENYKTAEDYLNRVKTEIEKTRLPDLNEDGGGA